MAGQINMRSKISVTTSLLLLSLLMSACVTAPKNVIKTISANNENIAVMGRTVKSDTGAVMFSYPGVTFSMNVKAKALIANIESSQGNNYIDVTIDNGKPMAIKIAKNQQKITLFSSDKVEHHHVVIQHRSESWHGTTTLHNLTLTDGELLTAPLLPSKKILFIGDSITCGDAIDREIPLPKAQCNKSNAWWNAKQTFGMQLSQKFNAQAHLVCYGGRGVVRTWQGKTDELNAEDFYQLAIPELPVKTVAYGWQQDNYQADLAVIVLGTNDFSSAAGPFPKREYFVKSYQRLIDQIRADHPKVKIAISDGPMLKDDAKTTLRSYLTDIAAPYKPNEVMILLAAHNAGDSCDYHPNKDKHKIIADDFYQPLKTLMHW